MDITSINKKTIIGLSARTNNHNEMNPATGKIAGLVQQFDQNVAVNYRAGARVYSVYYNYESDVSGDFSVLVGADRIESSSIELQEAHIPAGDYLTFSGQGEMPQLVLETWQKVWNYFSSTDCQHLRAYTTDFEFYKNQNDIEIHIAIK